jgi:hypothetical protein
MSTARYDSQDVTTLFTRGQLATVADAIEGTGNFARRVPYAGETVRIVGYWRNGYYRVEETDRPGIGVCIDAKHLTEEVSTSHTVKVLLTVPASERVAEVHCSFVGYAWSQSVESLTSGIKQRCISCGEEVSV